jgi:arylsulfatase A-like enzyme
MFTGLYPSQHQADWGHVHLNEGFPTLAEHLQAAEYQTVGFSENVFVGRSFGLARGFGEFHETWRRPLVVRAITRVATRVFHYKERLECAERSVGLFERWVSNNNHRGKPFFAFVNLMAAHLPRYPRRTSGSANWTKESLARIEPVNLIPERYYLPEYKLNQQDLAIMAEIYDGEISYLDSQIGNLISFLAKDGILDETIVILTSDHGENFGEHGLIEHQFCLYDTLLHVPLILRYPALLKPEKIEKRVSTVFLLKTVMTLVGTPRGGGSENSRVDPIGPLQAQGFIIAECGNGLDMLKGAVGGEGLGVDFSGFDKSLKCVIEGDYKFIWASNGKHELYRIQGDPSEVENVLEIEQDRGRALHRVLNLWELSTPREPLF